MQNSNRSLNYLLAMILIALGANIFIARASAQDQGWQVTRAEYGYKSYQADVTNYVLDLVSRGGMNGRVPVNNQTMGGDPAVGKDKTLRIFARNRSGQEHEFDYKEGSSFDISPFYVPRNDWDDRGGNDSHHDHHGFYIIRGFYGIQGRTVDVTGVLQNMVRDRSLSLNVNNRNLGGDPAVGADKILIVVYMYQGQEQATAVREGNDLSIP